jgi:excisionase family DNA binding protein
VIVRLLPRQLLTSFVAANGEVRELRDPWHEGGRGAIVEGWTRDPAPSRQIPPRGTEVKTVAAGRARLGRGAGGPRAAFEADVRILALVRLVGQLGTSVEGLVSERLLTASELAERLALSTSTVLDWFEAGRLPGFKLGRVVRFRESEVLDWLESQRVGPEVGGRRQPEVVA